MNPLTTEDVNSVNVMDNIFLPLLDFDPQTFELVPVLAKSRPIISTVDTGKFKGGASYTYEIRDEAVWDNGAPVTAADYIFTVKAILNKKSGANNLRNSLDFVKDIQIDAQNPKNLRSLRINASFYRKPTPERFGFCPNMCTILRGYSKNTA
ncbi:MAG: hypothetical protein HC817_08455 [Saprospiraceae bacterium]|nr:hypothetical protein [Saprospiraceae bacterium]